MTPRPVYVRSVGAVTPLGRTWPESAARLAEGRSAIGEVRMFDARGFPCSVGATVHTVECPGDRRLALARAAAAEAWTAAEIGCDPAAIGVFIGAESGRLAFDLLIALSRAGRAEGRLGAAAAPAFDYAAFGERGRSLAARVNAAALSPAAVASALAADIGALGPVETISLACASGSAAIAEAARAIRLGVCDAALAGGTGADIDPLMFAAFGLLGALSTKGVSRPFDAHRDGFVLGEAAAMAVLAADRGGAQVEIAGLGRTLDARHLTAPDPDGAGAARAMQLALAEAGRSPRYVQAHGTSTPLNDAVEAAALRRVLGADLERALVSSVKGAIGHSIAAAGAVGFLCAVEAVERGTLLPTAGLTVPDPECALPHITRAAVRRETDVAMVNAFGFGGANTCIVVRRPA